MARYVPIGEPMNTGEETGIRRLRDELPDHFVVIGNFELHMPLRSNSLEYDAVVLGEHAIYAVEIKGWSGEIDGDMRRWYLEWGPVESPFNLIDRKAKALRHFLVQALGDLPSDLYVEPVVFLPTDVRHDIDDRRTAWLLSGPRIWEFFMDERRILKHGPGPLLDADFRNRVLDVIAPVANEPGRLEVAGYQIEAELERPRRPYREYVGRHMLLRHRKLVRIKEYRMDPLLDQSVRRDAYNRGLRDMEALGQLEENPYIARAYDLVQDRDDDLLFYLVSEWVGPHTVADLLEGKAEIPPLSTRMELASYICEAVKYMHSRGIVHRDLHPGAIYLSQGTGSEVPLKIADFDYARVANLPSILSDPSEIGTQGYVAPELWADEDTPHDHRVDLFSLGVVLAELVALERLFPHINDMLVHEERWREFRIRLPRECAELIDVLLARDPDDRRDDLEPAVRYFKGEFRKSKN